MPLVLITGFPCSGKTYRAAQIQAYFTARTQTQTQEASSSSSIVSAADGANSSGASRGSRLTIVCVSDHALGIGRSAYATAAAEKTARAKLSAEIIRTLNPSTLVLVDAPNYIKGFRYQMFCEAKGARTASCVVHVGTPIERCRTVNNERIADASKTTEGKEATETNPNATPPSSGPPLDADVAAPYQQDVFDNLIQRYEEPNGMTRWDSPLFTVPYEDQDPPCEAIWDAIMDTEGKARVARPNAATVLPTARPGGSLSALERASQSVIDRIASWSQDHPGEGGGEITVDGVADPVILPMNGITQPQLQRLRRQFVGMNRTQASEMKKDRMLANFVAFLNDTWGTSSG